jgi:hypothetical protein
MNPQEAINFLLYPKIEGWLLIIKIVFLLFSLFFLGFIIWGIFKTTYLKRLFLWDLKEFLFYRPIEIEEFKKEWLKIKKRLESGIEAELKLALIEADSLVEEVLDKKGYKGKDFEERVRGLIPEFLIDLEEILKVHQLRDDIIEDPTLKIDPREIQKAISVYEKILRELDAI